MLALGKAVVLIIFWPIWSHFRKFLCEGRYLTSHGKARVEQRKKFIRRTIVSSRAQIVEICSEATFQPLLQLYLLLPKLMCFNQYHNLLEEDLSGLLSNVPKLQFWAIFTSCLSLAWSFNTYQASKKTGALDFESNLWGRLVLLGSCICLITSRLFVFVLLAYSFGDGHFYPMVSIVIAHMIVMSIVHYMTTPSDEYNIETSTLILRGKRLRFFLQVGYQCLLNGISNIYLYNHILPLPEKEDTRKRTETGPDSPPQNVKKNKDETECEDETLAGSLIHDKKQVAIDMIFTLVSLIVVIISSFRVEGIPIQVYAMIAILQIVGVLLKVVYYKTLHIWSGRSQILKHCKTRVSKISICQK